MPVTTLARTLVDLADVVPQDHLRAAMHQAERVHRNDVRELERVLDRTRTRNGRGGAVLGAALADARRHGVRITRSDLEEAFYGLTERFGVPRPRMNVTIHGCEVDAWWPRERVAVRPPPRRRRADDRPRWTFVIRCRLSVHRMTEVARGGRPAHRIGSG
jgi:hypothetical protein